RLLRDAAATLRAEAEARSRRPQPAGGASGAIGGGTGNDGQAADGADATVGREAASQGRPERGERLAPTRLRYRLTNRERTIGSALAGSIAHAFGEDGLLHAAVEATFEGAAGQSFGAFATPGMRLVLHGEAQDYVGKGLAGGELVLRPTTTANDQVIAGNTVLYGATGGALFAAGNVGERVCVRNSGALAVVEGCGDHGCEYMTGGTVVVLGPTGRNFGAGM